MVELGELSIMVLVDIGWDPVGFFDTISQYHYVLVYLLLVSIHDIIGDLGESCRLLQIIWTDFTDDFWED